MMVDSKSVNSKPVDSKPVHYISIITSYRKFSEGKQVHVGMEASKTNQTRMTPQYFHTIPIHLAPFCRHLHKYALCLLVVSRERLWKAFWWVVVGM